jgi:hypothetical protein
MVFIMVDLPEPLAPMIATNSPGRIGEVHAADGMDFERAVPVGAPEVLEFDDGLHGRRRGSPGSISAGDPRHRTD